MCAEHSAAACCRWSRRRVAVLVVTACLASAAAVRAQTGAASVGPVRPSETSRESPGILIVSEDDPTRLYLRDVVDGLRQRLTPGARALLHEEYLELSRVEGPGYAAAMADWLRTKYAGVRIDAVVTAGELAAAWVKNHPDGPWQGKPLVYAVYGRGGLASGEGLPNSTGVSIDGTLVALMKTTQQLLPSVKRVAVVHGTARVETRRAELVMDELRQAGFGVDDLGPLSLQDMRQAVSRLPDDAVILNPGFQIDGDGLPVDYAVQCTSLHATANRPLLMLGRPPMGCGILGGPLIDFERVGRLVADIVMERLAGPGPSPIYLSPEAAAPYVFDARELARWGIPENRLPAGSEVLFRPPSLWRDYRAYVVAAAGVIAVMSALLITLLVERATRRRAEQELKDSYEEVRALAGQLISVRESERSRIARELHDDVSQRIALLAIDTDRLAASLDSGHPSAGRADDVSRRIGEIAGVVHSLSHQLHPSKLETLGLITALRGLAREMSASSDLEVDVVARDVPQKLPLDISLCLFRIAQEALTNARKHSGASQASIAVVAADGQITLDVSDDGHGFEPGPGAGLGLVSMRERVRLVGGELRIEPAAQGTGTVVRARVPWVGAQTGSEQASGRQTAAARA